jgi:rhodanese-related sulfurtransferase
MMMKKFLLQALILVVAGSAIGIFYNAVSPDGISVIAAENKTVTGFRMMTTEEVQVYLKEGSSVVMVDARSPEEYALGHIPGAINIPEGQVELNFRKFEKLLKQASLLIIYCSGGSCGTSEEVAKELIAKGISNSKVAVDQDGLPGWIRTKNPIETGEQK